MKIRSGLELLQDLLHSLLCIRITISLSLSRTLSLSLRVCPTLTLFFSSFSLSHTLCVCMFLHALTARLRVVNAVNGGVD